MVPLTLSSLYFYAFHWVRINIQLLLYKIVFPFFKKKIKVMLPSFIALDPFSESRKQEYCSTEPLAVTLKLFVMAAQESKVLHMTLRVIL